MDTAPKMLASTNHYHNGDKIAKTSQMSRISSAFGFCFVLIRTHIEQILPYPVQRTIARAFWAYGRDGKHRHRAYNKTDSWGFWWGWSRWKRCGNEMIRKCINLVNFGLTPPPTQILGLLLWEWKGEVEAKNIGIILSVSEQYDKHFGTIQKQSIAH